MEQRLWHGLLAQDERYYDSEWVGRALNWRAELIDAARKLIAEL